MVFNPLTFLELFALLSSYSFGNKKFPNKTDCESVSHFIKENLSLFVKNVNEDFVDNKLLHATSVEDIKKVVTTDEYGEHKSVLINFNVDNGYILLGDDYEIYDMSNEGFSPFETIDSCQYFYSIFGGYAFEESGKKMPVKFIGDNSILMIQNNRSHYNGQEAGVTGYGKITDPDLYLSTCYGGGYSLVSSKSLLMKRYSQYGLSCYITITPDGGSFSEGNCGLVAAYHVLQYMQKTKFTSMPSSAVTTNYDPYIYEPNLYFKRFTITGERIYDNCRKNEDFSNPNNPYLPMTYFPQLYKETRMHTAQKYDKVEGLTINQTSAIIENIAKSYGYTVDAQEDIFYKNSINKGINVLNDDIPMCFAVVGDETYGNHAMAVCGYRKYSKPTPSLWFLSQYDYKILYEVADGHLPGKCYYDISKTNSLGALVFLEF